MHVPEGITDDDLSQPHAYGRRAQLRIRKIT
jgi:hypothetical protein